MDVRQKVVFVADQQSLMKIYDLACMSGNSDIPTMLTGLARRGMSKLGRTKTVESQVAMEKRGLSKIRSAAMIPGGIAVAMVPGGIAALSAYAITKKIETIPAFDLNTALTKIQQSLGIAAELTYLPFDDAHNIDLGVGKMPRNNCFYISDLVNENLYIPLQEYNKYLSKEKNNAFMGLAAALGAKSICLQEAQFYNSNGKLETDFSVLKPIAMDIGISASFEKDGSVKKEVHSTFGKRDNKPTIPLDLQKWVDVDSDLRLMVTHRLEHGLLSHKINLCFSDSLNGAAEISAIITGTNKPFNLKASGNKHVSSSWVFDVEYHPI